MQRLPRESTAIRIPLSFEQTVAAALETPPERKAKKKRLVPKTGAQRG